MFQSTSQLVFGLGVIGILLLGINFAIGPTKEGQPVLEVVFVFIAFFFLLELRITFFAFQDPSFIGCLLASLALTFFWMIRKRKSG